MIYVLDTDILGFVEERVPVTMRHVADVLAVRGNEVVTTIISVGEGIGGRLPLCRRAQTGREHIAAYAKLYRSLQQLHDHKWLPFDEPAAVAFDQLRAQKVRIGTNDLAIAAIALSVNAVMVTRNIVHFQRVPNLIIEDWTR